VLEVANLEVVYHDVILVVRGISFSVPEGEIIALLGANGAGKTTVLRAISGLLGIYDGDVTKGKIEIDGKSTRHADAAAIVRRGVTQVMEGRRIFGEFTVEENLRVGGHTARRAIDERLDRVFSLFPLLRERAMMSDPKYLLLDEPSLGLAPLVVQQVRDLILEINRQGTGILLVEQNAAMALSIASHGYVMETGKIVMDKPASDLLKDQDVQEFYLGLHASGGERKSFREVKHYKRRKRWLS